MDINIWAVIVCAIVSLLIGWVWYGPFFGKMWRKIMGAENMSPEQMAAMKKKMAGMMFLQFILSVISAWMLSRFISMSGVSGITMAFWVWLGFLMPNIAGAALWSGKPSKISWTMFLVSAGSSLITFLVFGFILSAWK